MKHLFAVIVGGVLLILSSSHAIQPTPEPSGTVPLPGQITEGLSLDPGKQLALSQRINWREFTQKYGAWSVIWNERTATPHRAFGPGISISGSVLNSESAVLAAAESFLRENAALLNVDPNQLELNRINYVNNRWYVGYVQKFAGIRVLLSEVELRIFSNGNLMALGIDFYPIEAIDPVPSISEKSAQRQATTGLVFDPALDSASVSDALFILPYQSSGEVQDFRLVYEVQVVTRSRPGNYVAYVDAHTGALLWRFNRVRYGFVRGSVSAMVQPVEPTDPFQQVFLFDAFVTVSGKQLVTDSLGRFSEEINSSAVVFTSFQGPFVNVNRADASDASFVSTVNPGDSVAILWEANNSHPAERDAFYHANVIHRYVTGLDPNFTAINYSMPCAVNINDVCNAFWDGTGINFFLAGGGCQNTAQMSSVVYHEYGHGINDKLYQQLGSPQGMINGATHEGLADVVAALLMDEPRVGLGFTGPGSFLRTLQNSNRYPEDNVGEVHEDGLIIGGAFWDLRMATSLQTARFLSHFAMYGRPDDPDNGLAFSEWYLETLIADDDDGNLGNGTPNSNQINLAFNNHGIGSELFMTLSFAHSPLPDMPDSLTAYDVNFTLAGAPVMGSRPDSVRVYYSIDDFQTTDFKNATLLFNNLYTVQIPAQPAGSIVDYYISALEPISGNTLLFPAAAPEESFSFLVGFQSVWLDDFEADNGWSVGAPDDDATTGIWERNIPQQTLVGSTPVQPGEDHSATGSRCFVTGAFAGNSVGANDVDNGKTTLFSPTFDLTGYINPVIRYYKWYSNDKGAAPGQDYWKVYLSENGGVTWKLLENTNRSTVDWEKVQFRVADFVTASDQVMLRFEASDEAPGSLVEALIDDFEILEQSAITSINRPKAEAVPKKFQLYPSYPNPFNPSTTIRYDLAQPVSVHLEVYSPLGQKIKTLFQGEQTAGQYSTVWDGSTDSGQRAASGVYLIRLTAKPLQGQQGGGFARTRKTIMLK